MITNSNQLGINHGKLGIEEPNTENEQHTWRSKAINAGIFN